MLYFVAHSSLKNIAFRMDTSYQIDSSRLFGLNSYYDVALGSWNGPNHDNAIILAKGIWMNLPGKSYISLEPSVHTLEEPPTAWAHIFSLRSVQRWA